MEDKQADNRIITKKQQIKNIDDSIGLEKTKLRKIDEMQEDLSNLNKDMSRLIDLLSKSVKGKEAAHRLENMQISTMRLYNKGNNNLEELVSSTKKNINNLYKEKENLIKDNEE